MKWSRSIVSDTLQPHGLQPTRLLHPWDFPGKSTGVGCHCLLWSINTNKASGGDGIPVELFQILKDDAVKVLHSICHRIWKTQQWPQDWKSSVFIPIPKKSNAKECSNYCTSALISQTSKVMLKILKPGFNSMWTMNFHMFKLDLEKAEEPEIKLSLDQNIRWIIKKAREFPKNIYF